jgi:hypothetical protein
MRRQRPRGTSTEAPYEPLWTSSEPWWPKQVRAQQLQAIACLLLERVLLRALKSAKLPDSDFKNLGLYARCC